MNTPFTPRLLFFQCQYALYAEADQQWVDTRLPENIKQIKIPCTGRLSPHLLLNAIQGGTDGVLICGCRPEKCHFREGNLGARRLLDEFVRFLAYLGMEPERVRFIWVDLSEHGRIRQELKMFEMMIHALGPARNLVTRGKVSHEE
jgi:F420-non-reducing hydrogenase iron-sulfur subunit